MKVEIYLRQWSPAFNDYYSVNINSITVGCIDTDRDGKHYFHTYAPFDRLDNDGKTQAMQAVNDRVVALNITARLLK